MKNSNRKISLLIVAHVCMYHMFIIVGVSCGCVAVFRQIKIVSVCIRKSPLTLLQSHNNNTHVTHMREYAVFEDVRAHRHNRRSCRRCRHWPRWGFTFFFVCVLFDLFHARTVVLLSTVVVGWLLANEKWSKTLRCWKFVSRTPCDIQYFHTSIAAVWIDRHSSRNRKKKNKKRRWTQRRLEYMFNFTL